MRDLTTDFEENRQAVIARGCLRPFLTKTGVWVRCGSRVTSVCASCAELYRGDWAAIARSGVFDGPVQDFRFYLLTLTAPSFGQVHRVPRESAARPVKCHCGVVHDTSDDSDLRGVPLDMATYDYDGQAAWNRDAGLLWDRTRRRVRDRWDSLEYFIVREWQDRGVLHVHALVRIARLEAPEAAVLLEAARTATAFSKVDGALVEWGAQAKCDVFRADGDGAKTIWYLSKALNYVMKDLIHHGTSLQFTVMKHYARLADAARRMRCSIDCAPKFCENKLHRRHGARSQVVSASRRTKYRTGWSFTGLTRTVQRRLRLEWFLSHVAESAGAETSANAVDQMAAVAGRAVRLRRELAPCSSAVP